MDGKQKKRRWWAALAILSALPLAGALHQSWEVRAEALRFPAPGRLVTVGQRRLHLVCVGEGAPTVIFEAGGFTSALSFEAARREVSVHTRVCSYDRAGMVWSDPGPAAITPGFLADDLKGLTVAAGLEGPFVLVPSSMGGIVSEMFARRYPADVAGLVFVDAGNSLIAEQIAARVNRLEVEAVCLLKPAARIGLLRLLDPFGLRRVPSEEADRSISRLYRVEPASTFCGLARGIGEASREWAMAPPLREDTRLVVLVHERPEGFAPAKLAAIGLAGYLRRFEDDWQTLQRQFAGLSRRGSWRVVPGSDHLIAASQPHVVAETIIEMVSTIRRDR